MQHKWLMLFLCVGLSAIGCSEETQEPTRRSRFTVTVRIKESKQEGTWQVLLGTKHVFGEDGEDVGYRSVHYVVDEIDPTQGVVVFKTRDHHGDFQIQCILLDVTTGMTITEGQMRTLVVKAARPVCVQGKPEGIITFASPEEQHMSRLDLSPDVHQVTFMIAEARPKSSQGVHAQAIPGIGQFRGHSSMSNSPSSRKRTR